MKKLIALTLVAASLVLPVGSASAATGTALKILTPKGGEKYSSGQNVPIKWSSSFPKQANVNISVLKVKDGQNWDSNRYGDVVENSFPVTTNYEHPQLNTGLLNWEIPFSIPAGNYAMQIDINYTEQFGYQYATVYSQKTFVIGQNASPKAAPRITNMAPNPVFAGETVTITGANFKKDNRVVLRTPGSEYYGNIEPLVKKSTKTSITFLLDQSVTPGNYDVHVENSAGISENSGLVVAMNPVNPFPFIDSVTPESGPAGTKVTLNGGNFSSKNDINYYSNDYYPQPYEDAKQSGETTYTPTNGYLEDVKSTDGKTLQFTFPEDSNPGLYTINVSNEKGYSDSAYFVIDNPDQNAAHVLGTNVRASDGTIYNIGYNSRSPYPSAAVFLSYKFNTWADVVPASTGDMELPVYKTVPLGSSQEVPYVISPRSGSLVNDRGTVYAISGDQRLAFTSAKTFLAAGYSFSNVINASTAYMVTLQPITSADSAHSNGALINDKGTMYVMSNGYRVGMPNIATLESWGYSASEAVTANANDLNVPISYVASKRSPGQLNFY